MKDIFNKAIMILKALLKRWSSRDVKRLIWDKEFANGKWDYLDNTCEDVVYQYVEKYANNGDILDLGCGAGNTGNEINIDKYQHYTGVDISELAIQRAINRSKQLHRTSKNKYVSADFSTYVPKKQYNVLLFRESIYYVPIYRINKMLDLYSNHLKDTGVFIVRMCDAEKYKPITNLIEKNYHIIEKYLIERTNGIIIVFSSQPT